MEWRICVGAASIAMLTFILGCGSDEGEESSSAPIQDAGTTSDVQTVDAAPDVVEEEPKRWCRVVVDPPTFEFTTVSNPQECDCVPGADDTCGATLVGMLSSLDREDASFSVRRADGKPLAPYYGKEVGGNLFTQYLVFASDSAPSCSSIDVEAALNSGHGSGIFEDNTEVYTSSLPIWPDEEYELAPAGAQVFVYGILCSEWESASSSSLDCKAYHYQPEPVTLTKTCCTTEDPCESIADCCGHACRYDPGIGELRCSG